MILIKKFYKYLLPVIIFSILLSAESCKKYEDGPWLSLRSKKARVVGIWRFKEVIADNKDITNDVLYDNIGFESGYGCYYISVNKITYEEATMFGTWKFADNKEHLIINLSAEVTDNITGEASTIYFEYDFKIKELRYKEIKLEGTSKTTFNGKIDNSSLIWTIKQ